MNNNFLAVKIFDKHAVEYQAKFMDVSLYSRSLDYFISRLPEYEEVLELGCGPGNITQYIRNQKPEIQITATDLSPRMLELALRNNPGTDIQLLDCRSLQKIQTFYSGIVCSFCIPYLNKIETQEIIKNIGFKLNNKGLVYLSFIKGECEETVTQESGSGEILIMHFYSTGYIQNLIIANILKILHTQEYASHDASQTDVVLVFQKN